MRLLSFVFGCVMTLFAAVQYNDPDGLLWGVIYLITTLFCFSRALNKPVSTGLIVCALGFLVSGILRWPYVDTNWINVEEAREGLGCLIVFVMLSVLAMSKPKSKRYF